MEEALLSIEPTLRLTVFLGVLGIMGVWEYLAPKRPRSFSKLRRWSTNLGLSIVNGLMLRVLVPVLAVGAAAWAESQSIGLLAILGLPYLLSCVLAFILLDLLIYGQHVLFHYVPVFWRLHQVHHADPDIDTSTGIRFHPIEILLSMGIKIGAVILLGAPAVAVILFEIVLNATSLFNHGNVRLAGWADRLIRRIFVTPDMHRVHHSVIQREIDSNFGFNFSIWDRLFGTYREAPEKGHEGMEIGLKEHQDCGPTRIAWSLVLPFRSLHGKDGP
ncbi:MAG: fatty acid hydroxylase [Parvibaculum sp.]|jgi:sterol desaturase/sphingolipid hydroxylase (fatty acid hydroxylase superfamily)|nr:fatty acid hydroxylase [Parvibaculum sp.]|tara:strand:+ start:2859 stop:3680 length:822 start_codon:yes stop_codon:yes gene_type:complete